MLPVTERGLEEAIDAGGPVEWMAGDEGVARPRQHRQIRHDQLVPDLADEPPNRGPVDRTIRQRHRVAHGKSAAVDDRPLRDHAAERVHVEVAHVEDEVGDRHLHPVGGDDGAPAIHILRALALRDRPAVEVHVPGRLRPVRVEVEVVVAGQETEPGTAPVDLLLFLHD